MNNFPDTLIFVSCIVFLIGFSDCDPPSGYTCCDQLNPSHNIQSTDCKCSNQTGGIGSCLCTTSPNTRQGWLCNTVYGDSVNINLLVL